MADIPDLPDINFTEEGYLFLVTQDGEATLRRNQALQSSFGVKAELMDRDELHRKFPSIEREDIVLGCHTPDDGWIDPTAGLWGFRRAAEHLGVQYIKARVTDIVSSDSRVEAVQTDDGQRIAADFFINTAGPWVGEIAAMTGAPACSAYVPGAAFLEMCSRY